MHILIPLVASVFPFILWPVELLLPYPFIIEEVAKVLFILFIIKIPQKNLQIKIVLFSAAFFTLSETVLYILNIALVGDLSTLISRFVITLILHSITMLLILIPSFWSKWLIAWGFAMAVVVHYTFNLVIVGAI